MHAHDPASPSSPRGVRPEPEAWSYARTLKDPATEEIIDLVLHRPVAYQVLRPWEHAPWRPTPTLFTLAGGTLGVLASAVALSAPDGSLLWPLAAFLMFSANILDCCDGMLARLTDQASSRGMLLDGMVDFIVGVLFWLVMSLRGAPDWGVWTVPAALSIILSILIHTALYDHIRIRFNVLVREPEPPKVVATPPQSHAEPYPRRGLKERLLDGFYAFAQAFYEVTYTNISRLCLGVEPSSPRPAVHPKFARQLFSGPMRMASYLGLGTHLFLMYCATALGYFAIELPFYIAMVAVVVGMNLWTVMVVVAWRRAEALVAGLDAADASN